MDSNADALQRIMALFPRIKKLKLTQASFQGVEYSFPQMIVMGYVFQYPGSGVADIARYMDISRPT
ncbi:MAG: hypothetical protein JXA19_06105, partial [Anaerolineales bacterium]|nr:hypothetical protein [Anaerolineales bacterium]